MGTRMWALLLALIAATPAAAALAPSDAGTFLAIDENGQPMEKVFRVSVAGGEWKFEDRQPDGSWLDVSCHGGCEHRDSGLNDLIAFFGEPPPADIRPECVQNEQYAFCHFMKTTPSEARDGYVLVVRIGEGWMPVSLVRLPEAPGQPGTPQPLESARAGGA